MIVELIKDNGEYIDSFEVCDDENITPRAMDEFKKAIQRVIEQYTTMMGD